LKLDKLSPIAAVDDQRRRPVTLITAMRDPMI
jgi:hypothetical protein